MLANYISPKNKVKCKSLL